MELLLGCGNSRKKKLQPQGRPKDWEELVTLDIDPNCGADYIWDLNQVPYPFEDNTFDEIHAYEVLEHLGTQGDAVSFFAHFSELWRLLKPDGLLCGSVPRFDSVWAWGDPSHRRIINEGTLVFLSQKEYARQVGVTAMTDFRHMYDKDFEVIGHQTPNESLFFVLQAIKPARTKESFLVSHDENSG